MKKTYLFLFACLQFSLCLAQTFPVGHTTITFNDPARAGGFGSGGGPGRQIQTEIYYPAVSAGNNTAVSAGSFPVIVFGHGFAMSWDAYQNIWDDLASKGYIIAFPRTEGSLLPAPSHGNFGQDLALVEVKLQNLNSNASSLFYQKVLNKSALMGHSMGGGATFLGAANNTSSTLKAVVGLAPAETNPSAISAALNVNFDALILSGSSDGVTPPASNHLPIYNNLPSTCKTFISITNGSHCYFANTNFNCDFGELTTGTGSLSRAGQQDITSDYLNLWLDFELKSSCTSWDEFLDSLATSNRIVPQQTCTYGYLQPAVNVTGPSTICPGSSSFIIANNNTNYNYTWYRNDTLVGNNNDSLMINNSGAYLVSASNFLSCIDSSNVFNVSLFPTYNFTDTVYSCTGSTYVFPDGFSSSQDITHTSNLLTQNNCDSIIQRTVIFGNSVLGTLDLNLCQGDSFSLNGMEYTSDIILYDTLNNASVFGCDSVTKYDVQFQSADSVFVTEAICQGQNYLLPNGLFTNQAGLYPFAYANQFGCDSLFTVDLIVGAPIPPFNVQFYNFSGSIAWWDTTYLVLMDTLSYDSLVWTTDGNSTLINQSGDTAYFVWNSIDPSNFITLTLHKDGCSRAEVTALSLVGIKDLVQYKQVAIYPNPTQDNLLIQGEDVLKFVQVYNLLGDLILEKLTDKNDFNLDCSSLSKGMYLLKTAAGSSRFIKN